MSSNTAKTIRPVVGGVGWQQNRSPGPAELAQIDSVLSTNALDKTGDTVVNTTISLQQDPNFTSVLPSISGGMLITGTGTSVASATITAGGSGYTAYPSVTFSAPPAGGTTATGTAVITNGAITAITITNQGYGYVTPPTITFGSGSATATAVMSPSIAGTGSDGTFQLNNNGFPQYSPATRTRTVKISTLETMQTSTAGVNAPKSTAVVVDTASGGVSQSPVTAYPASTTSGNMFFPLTKPMDGGGAGATITSVTVYWYLPAQPAGVGVTANDIYLYVNRVASASNSTTIIGEGVVNIPATPTGWFFGGAIQYLTINTSTCLANNGTPSSITPLSSPSNIIDLSNFTYNIRVGGPDLSDASFFPSPIFTGIEVQYSTIDGERFQQ